MKVQATKLAKKVKAGFSLVELLVVIAVIGIMAAIAIPMISNINANAKTAKDRRNAQNIASVYGAACAAGAANVLDDTTADAIATTLSGGCQGDGQFSTTTFRVNLSDADKTSAVAWLNFDSTNKVLTVRETLPTP